MDLPIGASVEGILPVAAWRASFLFEIYFTSKQKVIIILKGYSIILPLRFYSLPLIITEPSTREPWNICYSGGVTV
jgi:hypothetical protein